MKLQKLQTGVINRGYVFTISLYSLEGTRYQRKLSGVEFPFSSFLSECRKFFLQRKDTNTYKELIIKKNFFYELILALEASLPRSKFVVTLELVSNSQELIMKWDKYAANIYLLTSRFSRHRKNFEGNG